MAQTETGKNFDELDERDFHTLTDPELAAYADWAAREGDRLFAEGEHPDIVGEYHLLADLAGGELVQRGVRS